MNKSRQRARDTRRLYAMEEHGKLPYFLTRPRSLKNLQTLTEDIWKKEGTGPMPKIGFGHGIAFGSAKLSWYCEGQIELAPNERNWLILLHELTHALGHDDHNAAFVKTYFRLLYRYTPVQKYLIEETARQFLVIPARSCADL